LLRPAVAAPRLQVGSTIPQTLLPFQGPSRQMLCPSKDVDFETSEAGQPFATVKTLFRRSLLALPRLARQDTVTRAVSALVPVPSRSLLRCSPLYASATLYSFNILRSFSHLPPALPPHRRPPYQPPRLDRAQTLKSKEETVGILDQRSTMVRAVTTRRLPAVFVTGEGARLGESSNGVLLVEVARAGL
jgi:hypothetical protein